MKQTDPTNESFDIIKTSYPFSRIQRYTSGRSQSSVNYHTNCVDQNISGQQLAQLMTVLLKDSPKPAVFIARKLVCDYVKLVNLKIDTILAQDIQEKPIFRALERERDIVFDQIIEALGSIAEYCLPSLLKIFLTWYHSQLGTSSIGAINRVSSISDAESNNNSLFNNSYGNPLNTSSGSDNHTVPRRPQSCGENFQLPLHSARAELSDCGSPCGQSDSLPSAMSPLSELDNILNQNSSSFINSSAAIFCSPTPSSPDLSHSQQTISTLQLDYQSPTPAIISESQHPTSAINTSNSTATNVSSNSLTEGDIGDTSNICATNQAQQTEISRNRKLLIEYAFCRVLIEVFGQLHLHPGYQNLVGQVEDIAFAHFKTIDVSGPSGTESTDCVQLRDKYAKVIGVLAQTRFKSIKKRFLFELSNLKSKELIPINVQRIVTLIGGIRYIRVKMAPIEEFEASLSFLQELADYFLEVRNKNIKHALANLFIETLIPLTSTVKNEVRIPCLKNFTDTLWSQTLEMSNRKKHSATMFPLVTCLLCVSQRSFFLSNWTVFLGMCLSNLKNRDPKMCRVSLESLYRLIWVYTIRIKCESNTVTQARLQSIVEALFPRSSRTVVPRDAPLHIFVDIIHFIAQERLDFAMKQVIFDLLSVDRSFKLIMSPERMNVGLQAFQLIAYGLQSKEGEPPMPKYLGSTHLGSITSSHLMSSGDSTPVNLQRNHRLSLSKILNEDTAKSIGIHPYYSHILKSFNDILRALDNQFGKPLLLTAIHNSNKEPDHMITNDRKPKIRLFKTCIAAIPRLLPDGMSKAELIDLLSRMTIHIDEDIRRHAFDALQMLIVDFADWRLDAIEGFMLFYINHIDESMRNLVDNTLKILLQLVMNWSYVISMSGNSSIGVSPSVSGDPSQSAYSPISGTNPYQAPMATLASQSGRTYISIQAGHESISSRNASGLFSQIATRRNRALAEMRLIQSELTHIPFHRLVNVIQKVEAALLVTMCNSQHQQTRRLSSRILRECKSILNCYSSWVRMEQFGLRPSDDLDEEELSSSLKGSISADNLSHITAISQNWPGHSSVTSMNTQALISGSVSRMCISGGGPQLTTMAPPSLQHHGSQPQASSALASSQHDPYDTDIENHLADCFTDDDNSILLFWLAVTMLESDKEQEFCFALRLLKDVLPKLPFEMPEFVEELERNLKQMNWSNFPGLHALILRGCISEATYDTSIALLDYLTPILKYTICNPIDALNNERTSTSSDQQQDQHHHQLQLHNLSDLFPFHVMVLLTKLLSNYEDPDKFSLNIARRIALWCEENSTSKQLDNFATIMTLYSRRSFSKDAFQWTKCVVKYLYDAYPSSLPDVIPFLVELLEHGPERVQRLIAPILYCILSYVNLSSPTYEVQLSSPSAQTMEPLAQGSTNVTQQQPVPSLVDTSEPIWRIKVCLARAYLKYLGTDQWKEALQIFKLIISRSSTLATGTSHGRELPGRTLDFGLDLETLTALCSLTSASDPTSASSKIKSSETVSGGELEHEQAQQQRLNLADQPAEQSIDHEDSASNAVSSAAVMQESSNAGSDDSNRSKQQCHSDIKAALSPPPSITMQPNATSGQPSVQIGSKWRPSSSLLADSQVRQRLASLLLN